MSKSNKQRGVRPLAVQLSDATIRGLSAMAKKSGMTRHRYMVLVLERAVERKIAVQEKLFFSDEK